MTAHDISLSDAAMCAEIGECISALFDARARERIVIAYESGWIVADDAMSLLLSLELLEAP